MKHIFLPAIVIITGIIIYSCSKNLDTQINARVPIERFFKTPAEINGALIDNYNVLQREMFTLSRFVYGDEASDDAIKGGESIGDWADMEQIVENRPTPTGTFSDALWSNCYAGITRANLIIQKIDSVTNFNGDDALKKRYRSEAQFIRAFCYHYIAMAYGDAPLITKPITDYADLDTRVLVKVPVAKIWELVEADLRAAIASLPSATELKTGQQLGRASKGAAQAALGYALMFQRKYDQAVPVLKELVENGGYSLLTDYGAIFRPEGEFSPENLFEINFIKQDAGWSETCEGTIRAVYQMNRDDWGWGFNQPTQDLANEFEPGDPRIIYTLNWPQDEYTAGQPQKNSQNNPYGYHSRKVFLLPAERPASASCAGNNEIIYRLGDMYLLYAEALTQASAPDYATAILYLNKVRQRANATPKVDPERVVQAYTVAGTALPMRSFTTKDQLLQDIWHERRVELGMEGHRYWDLVRTNRTNLLKQYYLNWSVAQGYEAKGDLKGKFYDQWISKSGRSDYPLFPIPQGEIDKSQGNLKQTGSF